MSRTYVVTGSASGIGRAAASLLRHAGNRVIGVDLRSAEVIADLSTPQGREAAVDGILDEAQGRIDALIANAGLATPTPRTVSVNYFGTVALIEQLRPVLASGQAPRIAVTSSMASLYPPSVELVEACLAGDEEGALAVAKSLAQDPARANLIYGSTKRALSRWIRRVAPTPAYAGHGIPINAVGPGIVVTPMTADLLATKESAAAVDAMVPMPLNGHLTAEKVAELLIWLASEANTHLCGQTIYIDGGSDVVMRGEDIWSWND